MGLKTESTLIGSHKYHVTQLGSTNARALLVRLVRMFGPVFASILEDPAHAGAEEIKAAVTKVDAKTLATLLMRFSDRLEEKDLEYLVTVLGSCSTVELEPGNQVPLDLETQELHFSGGRLMLLFRWVGFALGVQYGDFFPGLGGISASSLGAKAQ